MNKKTAITQSSGMLPKPSQTWSKPPVVAVMGHVDHGKTTLLDFIRKSHVAAGEHGGITQHIGAYQITVGNKKITFIDTPGHEAFAKMRTRGARSSDLALLVVDANESVKPQTIESIRYIKEAGIPMIVAINKIDLPTADVARVKKELMKYDVTVEEFGGKIAALPISAKTGKGVSDLLDTILLVAEMKKISADPSAPFEGIVIESKKDSRHGVAATVLVNSGTLHQGDQITSEKETFKVRVMFDEYGKVVKAAEPGRPVEVLGAKEPPAVGSQMVAYGHPFSQPITEKEELKEIAGKFATADDSALQVIIKADSENSLEAIIDGLTVDVRILSASIGDISENDIAFAKTAHAFILGFNVKTSPLVVKLAYDEGVKIKIYTLIYKLFEEIADVVSFLKEGPEKELLGKAKIIQEFTYKDERIAGCQVMDGRIAVGDKIAIMRQNESVGQGRIKSIRKEKDEVTKVEKGHMCGVRMVGKVDFKIGDMIESYRIT